MRESPFFPAIAVSSLPRSPPLSQKKKNTSLRTSADAVAPAPPAPAAAAAATLLVPLQPADDPHEEPRLGPHALQVGLRELVDGLLGEPRPEVPQRAREPAVDVAAGDAPLGDHLLELAPDVVEVALLGEVRDGVAVVPATAAAVGVAEPADDAEQEARLVGHARERRLAEALHGQVGALLRERRERVVRRGVDVALAEVALGDQVLEVGLPVDRGRLVVLLGLGSLLLGGRGFFGVVVLGVGAGAGAIGAVAAVGVGARAGAGALCGFWFKLGGERERGD